MSIKNWIPTWQDRCEVHPDHQEGMVTYQMIQDRMQEEIDELREYIVKQARQNTIFENALKQIVEPWYQKSNDGEDLVDTMMALARVALIKVGGEI